GAGAAGHGVDAAIGEPELPEDGARGVGAVGGQVPGAVAGVVIDGTSGGMPGDGDLVGQPVEDRGDGGNGLAGGLVGVAGAFGEHGAGAVVEELDVEPLGALLDHQI